MAKRTILSFLILSALIAIIKAQQITNYCGDADRNAADPGGKLEVIIKGDKPPKLECVWKVYTTPGKKIELSVSRVLFQDSSKCQHNFLDIYYGNTTQHAPIDRLCCLSGGRSKVYTSSGFFIFIHLVIQTFADGDGITATYREVNGINLYQHDEDICGKEEIMISQVNNNWEIPLYGVEASNKQCRWRLIADNGKRVQLTIKNITFDADNACSTNKLVIVDGIYENETKLATICNMNTDVTVFTSTYKYMFVGFSAWDIKAGKGFTAEIKQINSARKMVFSEMWMSALLVASWYNNF